MFNFEQTSIWLDVKKIFNSEAKHTKYEITGVLHTKDEDIEVAKVISLDVVRDYVTNIGDIRWIEFILPLGDYAKRLYPYANNLEFTIFKREVEENSGVVRYNKQKTFTRYKAVFDPSLNPQVRGAEYDQVNIETLNRKDIVNVKLQLIQRALEPLRVKTTGGIYQSISHEKLLHAVLGNESSKVTVDGKKAVDGINMVKPDNTSVIKQVVIPDNLFITDLPTFLHTRMGGIYNAGIGTYLQTYKDNTYWFIYPLYKPERFNENLPKMVFYAVPRNRYMNVERTYRVDNYVTHVAITGERRYSDSAEKEYMDSGVGFRMADARAFMKKPVEITEDGPVGKRSQLNHEVGVMDRADGLNFASPSSSGISGNPYVEYSKLLSKKGGQLLLEWQNSNPDLIYPGMPCKFFLTENDSIVEIKGVILFAHDTVMMDGVGVGSKFHVTNTILGIYTESYSMSTDKV